VRYPIHPTHKFRTTGLDDLARSLSSAIKAQPWIAKKAPEYAKPAAFDLLLHMLKRFHAVAKQLGKRHVGRSTININDEYDVQDLLHALLRSRFDDVRPEEAAPSHGGANSRMDFLLKKERIVVEAKMTRPSLRDRQIGEELIVDTARYRGHPDCDTLVCFVYDPNGYILNPAGLESDLSGMKDKLRVHVIVNPK
jgi:hypothetical protein